ncbi:sulfotransferase family protein [Aidingimonas halophila]|uniref:Sulfotransferase family protein n=1 Tax=Aidingimonas halophila TaxID=574349 RepID=A0A1H3G7B2_9GAMM|nr:sulfotransferase [Aidingimonas halophila]GHC32709.1 hypothetical protein GCM10008094_26770 [Aidingimonas halophila]SDX99212.1 Sulfotransferase family protein [Aidingimonas halophila]
MKYVHSANHRATLGKYLRKQYKTLLNNLNSHSVRPLYSEVLPCFVVGCGHSGTTLTAAKLGNHSKAYLIGRETHHFAPAKGLYSSYLVASEWIALFETLGKKVFIEKTPKHVHAVDRILRVLPNARIIVMVRNPLDNCFSLFRRYGDLDYAIDRWNMDNRKALQVIQSSQAKLVSYESMTTAPQEEFGSICHFLGMEWDPSIIESGDTAYDDVRHERNMTVRQEQVRRPITPSTGAWKEGLTEAQVERVLDQTNPIAGRLGYT